LLLLLLRYGFGFGFRFLYFRKGHGESHGGEVVHLEKSAGRRERKGKEKKSKGRMAVKREGGKEGRREGQAGLSFLPGLR